MSYLFSVLRDARFTLRLMLRKPGFFAVAVGILALGVGATTAIFTVVNGVLLEPLDYEDPQGLVYIWDRLDWAGVPRAWVTGPELADLQDRAGLFEGFAGIRIESRNLIGGDEPERIAVMLSSARLFDLLGVRPVLGRGFRPDEEGPGPERVAVLDHGLWERRYGGDEAVIGRSVTLDDGTYTIVGVMPPDFELVKPEIMASGEKPAVYITFPYEVAELNPLAHSFGVIGRIGPDTPFARARAELAALGRRLDETRYDNRGFAFEAVPMQDSVVSGVRPYLYLLMGAVALVLLLVCANLATLFVGKSMGRRRELGVRRALGARPGTIVRQVLTESAIIGLAGGALGLVLAHWLQDLLLTLAPAELPRRADIALNFRVLGFNLCVALFAGLVVGLGPAIRGASLPPAGALAEGGRGGGPGRRATRSRHALVTFQVAISVILLAGAGLLARSFVGLISVDPGFDAEGVLTARIVLPSDAYAESQDRVDFFERLVERLEAMPGVVSAGATRVLPMSAEASQETYSFARAEAATGDPERDRVLVDFSAVTPGYFRAAGISVLQGRDFDRSDHADAPAVAIIDRTLAEKFWPTSSPLGAVIAVQGKEVRIVGVVEHARLYEVHRDDRGQVYHPHTQLPTRDMALVARVEDDPLALAGRVRRAVLEIDPNQPVYALRTLESYVASSLATRRFSLVLVGFFAGAALLLAAIGVFAVVSYMVAARTREIGLRMALGARPGRVMRVVLRRGMMPVVMGTAVGVGATLLLGRLIAGLLVGVGPRDPLTLAVVTLVLMGLSLLACYLPARRAASIDPMEAIRYE